MKIRQVLNFGTSFSSLASWLFLLAAIPTYFYVREVAKGLDAYEGEQQGLPVVVAGLRTIQLTQQHRGLSALVLGGIAAAQGKRDAKQSETDAAYSTLAAILRPGGIGPSSLGPSVIP